MIACDKALKVAITFNAIELGGAERVLEALVEMYPSADLFCVVHNPRAIPPALSGHRITSSFLNFVPGARKFYRYLQFLGPLAAETLDLSPYDLVITSEGSFTMGVLTRQDALHVCYCHSPHRALWDQFHQYRSMLRGPVKWLFTISSHYARICNYLAAQRVDCFVANSTYVSARIAKYYRRRSEVIYPPVEVQNGFLAVQPQDYYLSAGRLSRKKRLDLLIGACNRLERPLLICGQGEDEKRLRKLAGKTVRFNGRVPDAELWNCYAQCRAFLFAADEDFGIAPVEAQAFGRPVIAYGHGGSLETVRVNDPAGRSDTGVYFPEQTVESVAEAILRFEQRESEFSPEEIREHSLQFSKEQFQTRMREALAHALRGREA